MMCIGNTFHPSLNPDGVSGLEYHLEEYRALETRSTTEKLGETQGILGLFN